MPTVEELVARYALVDKCVPVPAVTTGVCRVCHGSPGLRYDETPWPTCWSCNTVLDQISRPCRRIVPVSLCRKAPDDPKAVAAGSQLYYWLKRYKSAWDPDERQQIAARLLLILAHFLERHAGCMVISARVDAIDVLTVVPSTRPDRTGPHPLHRAFDMLTGFAWPLEILLERGPGQLDRLVASDDAFVPVADVAGRTVVVLDDTFTAGSHAQSAASALSLAGADVVAVVPIGRLIAPGFSEETAEYWRRQTGVPFSFDTCCLE